MSSGQTIINPAAAEVATLVQRMTSQYFSHVAAMYVARDDRAEALAPPIEPGQTVPIIRIPRRDGNAMIMWFNHYLNECKKEQTREDFDKIWLLGALLAVGNALGANGYFGHCPEAEMIRHLRNGIAHGNRFNLKGSVIDKQTGDLKYAANVFRYAARQQMPKYEIAAALHGTEVLWTWGGPDAVIDCLTVLGAHLWNVGYGMP